MQGPLVTRWSILASSAFSGAGLGAVVMIVLGGGFVAPLYVLLGIYALYSQPSPVARHDAASTDRHQQRPDASVATMLLAGIAPGLLAGAMTGLPARYGQRPAAARSLTFWSMGSLAGSTWTKITAAGPIILLSFIVVPFLAKARTPSRSAKPPPSTWAFLSSG